jgi:predicted permease
MLTEIAWWGGLIFLWWAFCYWFLVKEWDEKRDLSFFSMHASFIFSAIILALYFYPLQSPGMQYFYLGSLGVAIIATLLMIFFPESEQDTEEEQQAETSNETDEEDETALELLAQVILFSPLIIACLLGLFKSFHIAKGLGLLG